jgi:hypothetical protein
MIMLAMTILVYFWMLYIGPLAIYIYTHPKAQPAALYCTAAAA